MAVSENNDMQCTLDSAHIIRHAVPLVRCEQICNEWRQRFILLPPYNEQHFTWLQKQQAALTPQAYKQIVSYHCSL